MKVIVAICLLIFPVWICCATKIVDPDVMNTFTSPDGAFRFQYSQILYSCQLDNKAEDALEPEGTCFGQMPICDDDDDSTYTITCLGYPKMEAAFAAAVIKDATSESACLKGPEDWPTDIRGFRIIHGVKFRVFEISSAWTSGGLHGELYRTFHANKCYELGIRSIRSSHSNDPDNTDRPTKKENRAVQKRLEQPLNSFRFPD